MRIIALVLVLSILTATPVLAGPNPYAALAMHTVASYEYLYCEELVEGAYGYMYMPDHCSGIDNSATAEELDGSLGYVYVVFLAYNLGPPPWGQDTEITGVEYCISGWPTTRGAPPTPPLNYCPEGSLVLGDPFDGGGVQGFGWPVDASWSCAGTVGFAWLIWNAHQYPDHLPLTLEYCASTYSYAGDPHNYVLGSPPDFEEDPTVSQHGCTIGGEHWEQSPYYEDCDPTGPTAAEEKTWGNMKEMYK